MIDTPREAIVYRRLEAADALIYRQLRLDALRLSPSSFGGLFEEEQAKDVSEFVDAIGRNAIFGAWNGTGDLVGTVGLFARAGVKLLHKGVLFGLFVAPDWRTKGIGRALVQHVIREARSSMEALQLAVATPSTSAVRLYRECGFREYGLERRALKIGGEYVDEYLMELTFDDC
tara:strand:+ start:5928 stop:6449 length:522 start_codon:yes stop_codon:yes gene_type:complete